MLPARDDRSSTRTVRSSRADTAYDTASTRTATGAERRRTSAPPTRGPSDWVAAYVWASRALADGSRGAGTIVGSSDRWAALKNIDAQPTPKTRTASTGTVRCPVRARPPDRAEEHGAEHVRPDEQRTASDPVDDDAGEQAEEQVGQPLGRPDDAERGLVGVQRLDEEQLERERRDERAEVRDRVGEPEAHERRAAGGARRLRHPSSLRRCRPSPDPSLPSPDQRNAAGWPGSP